MKIRILVLPGIFIGCLVQTILLFYSVNLKDDFLVESKGNKFFEIGWPLKAKYVPFVESDIRESSNFSKVVSYNILILALLYMSCVFGYMKWMRLRGTSGKLDA